MTTRRSFLQGAAAAAALAMLRGSSRATGAVRRPTKLVQIFLRGGFDAILSTDPKTSAQVDDQIDLPYGATDIIDVGGVRVGPLIAPLRAHVPAMAILNGVDNGTVGHGTGLNRVLQMKRHYAIRRGLVTSLTGAIGGVLGEHMPLADAWFLPVGPGKPEVSPARRGLRLDGWGPTKIALLDRMWEAANEAAAYPVLDRALGDEVASCLATRARTDCDSLADTRALFAKLRGLPKPSPITPLPLQTDELAMQRLVAQAAYEWAAITRDLVYMLEHELTPCAFVVAPHGFWDSHQSNQIRQQACMRVFAAGFSHLAAALEAAGLADTTAIVISSELGRFPVLNGGLGKDHFPQHPFVFMGPGISTGQFGSTDRRMIAQPIAAATGRADRNGFVPTLDDVGATIVHWFGLDGEALGYRGRPLPFLNA